MPARRLFLSYARPERQRVDILANDLRRAGCDVFLDEQLTTGENWWNALLDEIERCDAFVPVLSKPYIVSTPCRLEADYAHALGKPLLPIMIEVMNPDECASFIAEAHCLSYDHADANSVLDLARALMTCPDCPALPEAMPTRPAVPRSYAGLTVQSLRDQLDATDDLTRHQQVLVLADLKAIMTSSEVSPSTCRELLLEFSRRPELTFAIATEVAELLSVTPDETVPPESSPAAETHAPAEPTSPPQDDSTVTLTCGKCSTANVVPKSTRGYICGNCEAVTEFPACKSCGKTWRLYTPKGTGGANYVCASCNSHQWVATAVSDSSSSVVCICGEWNVLANGTKGFTCGACKAQQVFFRCPKCKDGQSVAAPTGKASKVSWKSGCGKLYSVPRANAATQGAVVPVSTLYPRGLVPTEPGLREGSS